jgi:hypothetical protein
MKNLLVVPIKIVVMPLLIIALLILSLGSLLINGPSKTNQKLSDLSEALNIKKRNND